MPKFFTFIAAALFCLHANAQYYQWARSLTSSGSNDYGISIATDASGDVYVAGVFSGTMDFDPGPGTFNLSSAGSSDIFLAKYTSAGAFTWAKRMGGTGADECKKMIVDASSNVYIVGGFTGMADFDPDGGTTLLTSTGLYDGFFARYTSAGTLVWAKQTAGPLAEFVQGIAVDNAGLVYICGLFENTVDFDPGPGTQNLSTPDVDAFVARYDANGAYMSAFKIGSNGQDAGYDITVDATGTYYVTGYFDNTVDFDPGPGTVNLTASGYDVFLAAYSAANAYVWADRMGGTGNTGVNMVSLDQDASGTLYITGEFTGTADFNPGPATANLVSAGQQDVFFGAYDNAGNYIYAKRIGGTSQDYAYDIAAAAGGIIYLTGYFSGTVDFDPGPSTANLISAGSADVYIARYDASGNYSWAVRAGSTGAEAVYGIYTNGADIYSTGFFSGTVDFDPGPGTANLTAVAEDVYIAKYLHPLPLGNTTTQVNPVCSGQCTGQATVIPAGGLSPYTYSWSNAQTTATVTGLCAGSYTVQVTDALSSTTSATVIITTPSALALSAGSVSDVTCSGACNGSATLAASGGTPGYTYSSSPVNLCAGSYTFTVTDANGCAATANAVITEPPVLTLSESHTNNLCSGLCNGAVTLTAGGGVPAYTYSGPVNSLCAGTYTYTVTDGNGCTAQTTATVTEPAVLTATLSTTPGSLCTGNCAVTDAGNVTGGTAPYTFVWMPGNITTAAANVCPVVTTTYTCTITDANNCTQSETVTITVNPLPAVTYTQLVTSMCSNWSAQPLTPGSPAGGTYSGTAVTGNSFDPAAAGQGTFTVVYSYTDSNGCSGSDSSLISVDLCTGINAPVSGNEIVVYPNPFHAGITVTGISPQYSAIELYTVFGELVYTTQTAASEVTLDLRELSGGIYYLRIMAGDNAVMKKILKH